MLCIIDAAGVDLDFSVNVTTGSDGRLFGGSDGHSDTAADASLAVMTMRLNAGDNPKIVERVRTLTTPGATVDAVVTKAGVAVTPRSPELADALSRAGIDVVPIARLHDLAAEAAEGSGRDRAAEHRVRRIVALQQDRDGTIIDVLRAGL
ncbi:citrate lyase subunit alpha [Burkholderia cenocepacia]|uniref:citrate lyase subunit alpha n=1 Tax=Burkholderia cenocepacia TaxID=95486 RepID=UPI0021F42540|nr:citrate lyase subunit alpha [Burkholderia cenocepacia]